MLNVKEIIITSYFHNGVKMQVKMQADMVFGQIYTSKAVKRLMVYIKKEIQLIMEKIKYI